MIFVMQKNVLRQLAHILNKPLRNKFFHGSNKLLLEMALRGECTLEGHFFC